MILGVFLSDNQTDPTGNICLVLQGFNSVLTMLDSRNSGDSAGLGGDSSFGRAGPMDSAPGPSQPSEQNFARELDDEVPF